MRNVKHNCATRIILLVCAIPYFGKREPSQGMSELTKANLVPLNFGKVPLSVEIEQCLTPL